MVAPEVPLHVNDLLFLVDEAEGVPLRGIISPQDLLVIVEHLEDHAIGRVFVAGRDLRPEGVHFRPAEGRVLAADFVVVLVKDDGQAVV